MGLRSAAATSLLSTSVDGSFKGTSLFDAGTEGSHRFSYNVNRTGNHHQAARAGGGTGLEERRGDVGSLVDVDGDPGGGTADFGGGCGARIVHLRGNDPLGERKKDLGDFADRLVAHRSEHENERPLLIRGG